MSGTREPGAILKALHLGVLAERDVRLYLAAYLASMIGTGIMPVALTFAVLETGGTTSDVGNVLAAETGALVVLLLVGGVIADRVSRRTILITCDLLSCASQIVLATLLFRGDPALWQFMLCAAILGACQAFFFPAQTGLVPEIASATGLHEANALLGVARSGGMLVGAAIGGVVVAAGGAAWGVAADALSFAISAVFISRLQISPRRKQEVAAHFFSELRLGWYEFRSRTWLWVIVVQFSFMHLLVFAPFMVLGAVTADEHLGGPAAWGAILSAEGLGAIVGGLLIVRRRVARPLLVATVATFALAAPLVLLALRAPTAATAVAAATGGAGIAVFGTLWQTTLQQQVPPEVLSRVSAYDWFGSVALFPVGYALVGPLSSVLGVSGTLWLAAGWLVAGTTLVLMVPGVTGVRCIDAGRPALGPPAVAPALPPP